MALESNVLRALMMMKKKIGTVERVHAEREERVEPKLRCMSTTSSIQHHDTHTHTPRAAKPKRAAAVVEEGEALGKI